MGGNFPEPEEIAAAEALARLTERAAEAGRVFFPRRDDEAPFDAEGASSSVIPTSESLRAKLEALEALDAEAEPRNAKGGDDDSKHSLRRALAAVLALEGDAGAAVAAARLRRRGKARLKSRPRSRARDVRRRVRRLRAETPRQRRGEEETRQLVVRVKASAASKRATRGSFFEGIFFLKVTATTPSSSRRTSLVTRYYPYRSSSSSGRAPGALVRPRGGARPATSSPRSVLSRQPSPRRTPPGHPRDGFFLSPDAETRPHHTNRAPLRSRPAPPGGARRTRRRRTRAPRASSRSTSREALH